MGPFGLLSVSRRRRRLRSRRAIRCDAPSPFTSPPFGSLSVSRRRRRLRSRRAIRCDAPSLRLRPPLSVCSPCRVDAAGSARGVLSVATLPLSVYVPPFRFALRVASTPQAPLAACYPLRRSLSPVYVPPFRFALRVASTLPCLRDRHVPWASHQ